MPERWLSQLQKIDRVESTYGLLERAEAGPLLPEPGPRPTARAGAVIVAALVAVAGIWGRSRLCRGLGVADGVAREDTGAFEAVWPETSLSDAQQVQERVDAADPAVQWRTDAADVAIRYAKEVLGWPDPIAGVRATDDADIVSVSIFGPIASCTGAACEAQPQQIGNSPQPRSRRALRRGRDLERHRTRACEPAHRRGSPAHRRLPRGRRRGRHDLGHG